MSTALGSDQTLLDAVRQIARDVAAPNAVSVDREARFPTESIDALREVGALSAIVPSRLGGGGIGLEPIAAACRELGHSCGASAMVFAMHQIQLASIVRHLRSGSWFEQYLADLCREQRLIASVTSEVGTGGDMGRSVAAVETTAETGRRFEKQAPTVSYGAYADDLLTTLRAGPEAEANDQVAVLTHKEQTELEPTGTWDVLGMRGTCSPGSIVRAEFGAEQVMEEPFAQGRRGVDGADLARAVVVSVARDRRGRVRAGARVRARRCAPHPRDDAAGRAAPVACDDRAVDAARRRRGGAA